MNFDNYIDLPEATPLALTVKKSVAPSSVLVTVVDLAAKTIVEKIFHRRLFNYLHKV